MKTFNATKMIPAPAQSRIGTICSDAQILDPVPVARPKTVPMPEFGVVVFESRHAPDFTPSVLKQDFSEFLLVVDGKAHLEGGGRAFELSEGSFLHIPAGEKYFYRDVLSRPVTLYALQYKDLVFPASIRDVLDSCGIIHWNLNTPDYPQQGSIRAACLEMLFEQQSKQPGWESVLSSKLLNLGVWALRLCSRSALFQPSAFEPNADSKARVASYAVRLRTQFFQHKSLDEAARTCGLSRRRFTELFRESTGQSWHKYILSLRMEYAKELLCKTEKTIIAVAFESGFEDVSSFNHVFKEMLGCSPS
ncbi:MAG: helix-turn-helix domain-containing protein, partial [Verrucomicrobiota bacterium]